MSRDRPGRVLGVPAATPGLPRPGHDSRARPKGGVVEPGAIGVLPLCPVAAQRGIDDERIHCPDGCLRELEALATRRQEIGEEHICLAAEPPNQLRSTGPVQRDREGPLTAVIQLKGVVHFEIVVVALRAENVVAVDVAAGGFDLDDVGAEIAHQRSGGRRRQPVRDLHHRDAAEGCLHSRPPYPLSRSRCGRF